MLPGLSEIGRCFSVEVRRSFVRFIVSRLWVLVGGEGESLDDSEVGFISWRLGWFQGW